MVRGIKTFRKGARVRYVGLNERYREEWGNGVYTVMYKSGDSVTGYFPMRYSDGKIHSCKYSVKINELEIV